MQILIIETKNLWQIKCQLAIEQLDYSNNYFATTINEATSIINNNAIDLCIASVELSNENIFMLYAKCIKAKDIPTIFVTAVHNDAIYKNAEVVTRFLFLDNPFNINTLKSAINLLVSKSNYSEKLNEGIVARNQFNEFFLLLEETELLNEFSLNKLEKDILFLRLQKNKSFAEIGKSIGYSGDIIRRIFMKSIKKIKTKINRVSGRYKNYLEFIKSSKNKVVIANMIINNDIKQVSPDAEITPYLNCSIDELQLINTKWKNVLYNKHIRRIKDLTALNKRELLMFPHFGTNTVSLIELELSKMGLSLRK